MAMIVVMRAIEWLVDAGSLAILIDIVMSRCC